MKNGKMMRGFMCQSTAVNGGCIMAADPRSVVIPARRLDDHRQQRRLLIDDTRLINNASSSRYSRLNVESRRFVGGASDKIRSTTTLTPFVSKEQNQQLINPKPKPLQKQKPLQLPNSSDHVFQVVVMRVSLHCQGCAGKLKKHLSKIEGVTSFSIELESKRVTVMGHVSPVGVLESISKVKKAEFWPC